MHIVYRVNNLHKKAPLVAGRLSGVLLLFKYRVSGIWLFLGCGRMVGDYLLLQKYVNYMIYENSTLAKFKCINC